MSGKKLLVLGDMAELGDDSEIWHIWAGKMGRMMGVEEVFTIGGLAVFRGWFGEGAHH